MTISHQPVFDFIVDTLGNQLRPTKYDMGNGDHAVDWNLGGRIKEYILPLGPWDMHTELVKFISFTPPFTANDVISISGTIYYDDLSATYLAPMGFGAGQTEDNLLIDRIANIAPAGTIKLTMSVNAAGIFLAPQFSGVVINRGYLIFRYRET